MCHGMEGQFSTVFIYIPQSKTSLKHLEDLPALKRFLNTGIHSGMFDPLPVFLKSAGCQGDNWGIPAFGDIFNPLCDFNSIHPWHAQVHKNGMGIEPLKQCQRLLAV